MAIFQTRAVFLAGFTSLLLAANVAVAAESKPVAYAIVEVDVRQPEPFAKEFFPVVTKVFAAAGATFVVKPSAPVAVDDIPPKRVAILRFDSVDQAAATFASQAYRDARKIGDQYASFRIFIVQSTSP